MIIVYAQRVDHQLASYRYMQASFIQIYTEIKLSVCVRVSRNVLGRIRKVIKLCHDHISAVPWPHIYHNSIA
jgi:hypothetical protein